MEKAYDVKELGRRLKEAGLIELEDAVGGVYKEVSAWIKESAIMSENPYDDIVAVAFPHLDKVVLPKIDAIDGQEG